MGGMGQGAQGSGRGRTGLPGWDLSTEWSHVTESQGQSLAVSQPHCEPRLLGEHFGLLTQHVLTQPVCRSWDCPHPTQEGSSERCRPSRKVTKLEGRLGIPDQDCGTPGKPQQLLPRITQPLADCPPRTVEISPTAGATALTASVSSVQ